jgi:hypothetical protein
MLVILTNNVVDMSVLPDNNQVDMSLLSRYSPVDMSVLPLMVWLLCRVRVPHQDSLRM